MTERILKTYEREYQNMKAVAAMLTALSNPFHIYKVEDVYLDLGLDWKWTTISRDSEWGGVQILSPRDWQEIVSAETAQDFADIVNKIRLGEYFHE